MREDFELLAAWRDGDRSAGDALVRRHFDSICRFFRTKLGDDVEDLIQRTFLDCVESRDRIRAETFRSYLFGIARNRLADHLRGRLQRPAPLDLDAESVVDLGTSPSQKVARSERERILVDALRQLPVDHQITLELAYWEDMRSSEIAAVLGISEHTVRSRLVRAREGLRQAIERTTGDRALRDATYQAVADRTRSLVGGPAE